MKLSKFSVFFLNLLIYIKYDPLLIEVRVKAQDKRNFLLRNTKRSSLNIICCL